MRGLHCERCQTIVVSIHYCPLPANQPTINLANFNMSPQESNRRPLPANQPTINLANIITARKD